MTEFSDRTVIVTGAARGIGHAIALRFAELGADVVAVDIDDGLVRSAANELGVTGAALDVADTAGVEQLVARTVERTGRIDVLVNNAGTLRDNVIWKTSDEDWETVLGVHLGGTFRMTRACVPHFRSRNYGRIVNVTSYTGLHGNVGQCAYAAAKAGIIGFTKTTAKELARFGVTANVISPNAATRMVSSIPEDRRREIESQVPLGRFAQPVEISTAVSFLASQGAGYITGAVLPVDGGLSM